MNKKGSIPIIILVLGIFAVCSLALLSFYSSNFKVKTSFAGINLMEKMYLEAEENIFYKGYSECFIVEKNVTRISPGFNLDWKKEKTIFLAEYCS